MLTRRIEGGGALAMGGSRSPGGFAGGCRGAVRGLARNMRSGRLPHSCGAGVAVLLLVGLLPVAAGAVKELAFEDMDPSLSDQVVLMYRSGEETSDKALSAFKDAETRVKAAAAPEMNQLQFFVSDAAKDRNGDQMEQKGLVSLPAVYISIKDQGRERYLRELSGEKLAAYIEAKFQSSAEDDVFPFSRELITEEYPLLAMFHERWCNRCNEFRKAFETAASQTSGHVMFMEVECSTGADAQKFCDEHAIDGFPSLVLTGGKKPWKPKEFDRDRSVQGILEFLETHVPDVMAEVAAEKVAGGNKE